MTDVYLDFNATAPVRPQAATAIARALEIGGNASSVHRRGRMARRTVEDAREQIADAYDAADDAGICGGKALTRLARWKGNHGKAIMTS